MRGAYTGAVANRAGRFEAAHTGTIFLDEINSTSLILQVKLLRVLQEREFERVGDVSTITVDTRVIAASNRDLADEVAAERFREDLYWRLNVVPVQIPPLRKRREDIPELVAFFLNHYSAANDRYVVHIQKQALEALQSYNWPGNVRELQNYVERAVVMAEGDELSVDLLPAAVTGRQEESMKSGAGANATANLDKLDLDAITRIVVERGIGAASDDALNLHQLVVDRVEKELIAQVLTGCNFVQTKAAARLGINRNTLHKKLKDYDLESLGPSDSE